MPAKKRKPKFPKNTLGENPTIRQLVAWAESNGFSLEIMLRPMLQEVREIDIDLQKLLEQASSSPAVTEEEQVVTE